MKKTLTRTPNKTYYYEDSERIEGVPKDITGDLSGVRGNPSGVTGDLSGITGDLSGITGDLSGVTGNLSGISGNLDDCDITKEEREKGIDINELIK